jgi:hypothetical protein
MAEVAAVARSRTGAANTAAISTTATATAVTSSSLLPTAPAALAAPLVRRRTATLIAELAAVALRAGLAAALGGDELGSPEVLREANDPVQVQLQLLALGNLEKQEEEKTARYNNIKQ